jgi:DNA-binding NarL/FixJ family response regulator
VLDRIRTPIAVEPVRQRNPLTPQERNILQLIAEGKTNREIAGDLGLAEKTVKYYVSNLLAKLGMHRRSQAAAYAARLSERTRQPT